MENGTLNIKEDFLQFVQVHDVTGRGLANSIIETRNKLEINSLYMVGQGYDGAAAMRGQLQGAQQYIRGKKWSGYLCALRFTLFIFSHLQRLQNIEYSKLFWHYWKCV